jgi:methyl-accepting chemotaxis protein
METAVEKIPKAISNQTAVVEETNRTVASMNVHIDKIQRSTIQTNDIAQELSRIATDSKDIVLKSKNSISQVAENSKFISEVLQNIQEIVEESNFLSINASIESAHAGEAGKGFSILANEIRELANKSRERLEMSQSRLKQMISFINESLMLSEQVTNQLLTIIENTQNSAGMISNITALMTEHKAESNAILEGSGTLLQDTLSIKNMTDEDQLENEKLQKTLQNLKESFEDMANLLRGQTESESNIRDAIDHIKEVLAENLKTIDILKETVMIAADNKGV